MKGPTDAVVAVTHRCNAHCVMCNIWKGRSIDRLLPEHLAKLPASLRTVNLSGGEPFLRSDLDQFVAAVRRACLKAQITISTNAYLPQRIVAMMQKIIAIDPTIRLAISLDGIDAAHDRIRGDEGVFRRVVELIGLMRALPQPFGGLRLGMTLSEGNCDQLAGVADFARQRGLELGIVAAHGCRTHLGTSRHAEAADGSALERQFGELIGGWLRSMRPKQWVRAHFAWNTYRVMTGRRAKLTPRRFGLPGRPGGATLCRAGEDFLFLQADGNVYNCSVLGRPMGNVVDQSWQDIWHGPAARAARQFGAACGEGCWMICNARSVYRRHAVRIAMQIAWLKLRAHLRLPAL